MLPIWLNGEQRYRAPHQGHQASVPAIQRNETERHIERKLDMIPRLPRTLNSRPRTWLNRRIAYFPVDSKNGVLSRPTGHPQGDKKALFAIRLYVYQYVAVTRIRGLLSQYDPRASAVFFRIYWRSRFVPAGLVS